MINLKKIVFFINQYQKHLQKKWKSLLLLFIFPIVFISIIALMMISLLNSRLDSSSIQIALVDEDDTQETKMIRGFLQTSFEQDGNIELLLLEKEDAIDYIEDNVISAYIVIPKDFTGKMYQGESLTIPIVGNSKQQSESFIAKEIIDSFTRYIESAQANILTVYDYARKTNMAETEYHQYRYDQFLEFTLFTLGKGKLVTEEKVTNIMTSSPTHFFTLSGWFVAFSIWLLGFYVLLRKEETSAMDIRLTLLGVSKWQNVCSKIIVSFISSLIFAIILFYTIVIIMNLELYLIDYLRLLQYAALYGIILLLSFALIDIWFKSSKTVLILQMFCLFLTVLLSGSIIPSIYLPVSLQNFLPFIYSNETFNWMVDITLEERNYAEYNSLYLTALIGILVSWGSTVVKKRWIN
nr:ABC transporter permease [Lysinibacillus timonensis]